MTASETDGGELEGWTLAAARAAEQGQWDRVEECYQEREVVVGRSMPSQEQIALLLAVDQRIQAQALVAKTAIAEQLRQSFATRMRLKGLRFNIGESGGHAGTFRMKA